MAWQAWRGRCGVEKVVWCGVASIERVAWRALREWRGVVSVEKTVVVRCRDFGMAWRGERGESLVAWRAWRGRRGEAFGEDHLVGKLQVPEEPCGSGFYRGFCCWSLSRASFPGAEATLTPADTALAGNGAEVTSGEIAGQSAFWKTQLWVRYDGRSLKGGHVAFKVRRIASELRK